MKSIQKFNNKKFSLLFLCNYNRENFYSDVTFLNINLSKIIQKNIQFFYFRKMIHDHLNISFDGSNTSNITKMLFDQEIKPPPDSLPLLNSNVSIEVSDNNYPEISAKVEHRRKFFTLEEDLLLQKAVVRFKNKDWNKIAKFVPGRTPKQCRDRWTNYLHPSLAFTPWTYEESQLLVSLVNKYGTHWSKMKKSFPNRSTNSLKNRWYSLIKDQVKVVSNAEQINNFFNMKICDEKKECINQYALIENVSKKKYSSKNVISKKNENNIKKTENIFNIFKDDDIFEFSNDELYW